MAMAMAMRATLPSCSPVWQCQSSSSFRSGEEGRVLERPGQSRPAMAMAVIDESGRMEGRSHLNRTRSACRNSSKQHCSREPTPASGPLRLLRRRFRLGGGMRFSEKVTVPDHGDGYENATWRGKTRTSSKTLLLVHDRDDALSCRCSAGRAIAASTIQKRKSGDGGANQKPKSSALQSDDVSVRSISSSRTSTIAGAANPVAVVLITGLVVAAAVALKKQTSGDEVVTERSSSESESTKCESCDGSGLCVTCNGEGFVMRTLSKEAADRARQTAATAATRYTAGLAKKWSYCPSCSGGRSCPVCQKRD